MLQDSEKQQIANALSETPTKIVLSNPADKSHFYRKTVLHKISLKEKLCYQIERFTQKQVFHENISEDKLKDAVLLEFPCIYTQLNIFGNNSQWDFKISKKGKLLFNVHGKIARDNAMAEKKQELKGMDVKERQGTKERRITVKGEQLPSHNRKKNYLLKEGTVIPPLVDLGIFTNEGKIIRSKYDKYKQINRYLEMVEDVIKDYDKRIWHIIDFGCGKSYLTFILYYYLVKIKGMSVEMTGLDLKADVIAVCNATAKKYGYSNLHFEMGDINGYRADKPVDMVVTLHACDTATDYALYNAINWKADVILSVPCCQHELNDQMSPEHLTAFNKYGIIKDRMAALMTDTIRGCLLEYSGYKTQLLEFIDIAHSPKNILIRAVRTGMSEKKRKKSLEDVYKICREFGLKPTLLKLLEGD